MANETQLSAGLPAIDEDDAAEAVENTFYLTAGLFQDDVESETLIGKTAPFPLAFRL